MGFSAPTGGLCRTSVRKTADAMTHDHSHNRSFTEGQHVAERWVRTVREECLDHLLVYHSHNRSFTEGDTFAERWVRTVREECLDHLLVYSRRHLETVLAEYVDHYNRARPHRGLQPTPSPCHETLNRGEVRRHDVLGGIIHEYDRAA